MIDQYTCGICGACDCIPRYETPDINRNRSGEIFRYFQCQSCGSVQLCNIPEDIGLYYGDSYYPLPKSADELLANSKHDRYKLEIVRRYKDGGQMLEIGPGTGGFSYLAKLSGFEVDVIELDQECRRFISSELGIGVLEQTETLEGNDIRKYDVIALWHVLEHLPEPGTLIGNLSRHLKPGGCLVLATPNPQSIQSRLFGKYWVHLDAPRHINLVPFDALEAALQKFPLEVVYKDLVDEGTLYWNRFGWIYSCRNLPGPKILLPVYNLLGLCLASVSYILGKLDPSRSAYTMVARRGES